MISVIIPHHQETVDIMNGCLSSLDTQLGIDFNSDIEVIIINDDLSYQIKDFSKYKNIGPRIRQLFNARKGYMGISRQLGIDSSVGDYLMFIDSDDMLASPLVICDIVARTKQSPQTDVFCYKFYEEVIAGDNSHKFIEHNHDFTWMFAKAYKKEFIKKNGIAFHTNVLWHEDTYFNQLLLAYNPQIETIQFLVYVWRCLETSITRNNKAEYTYSSLGMFIDAHDKVLEKIYKQVTPQQLQEKVIWVTAYLYCLLSKAVMPEVKLRYRGQIEFRLGEYIHKWSKDDMLSANSQLIASQVIQQNADGMFLPEEGYTEFVKRVESFSKK